MRSSHLLSQVLFAPAAALAMLFAVPAATAAPVQIDYEGHVVDYSAYGGPVDSVLPLGSSVQLEATFDHRFAGGTYPFDMDLGPASGTLTLAGVPYSLSAVSVYGLAHDYNPPHAMHWVQLRFDSDGPDGLADAVYRSFTLVFAPDLSTAWGGAAGFAFGSGWLSYANFSTDRFDVTRLNAVPAPATLPLSFAALMLLAAAAQPRRVCGQRPHPWP
ncbi:hypothetical protein [Pseudorhodoferax sp.]|uniref:hypothetical protein n=1 Tax=Pseudorhodoferax sp. TaxID=1993553 RepID=UPI002DD63537|nr:hypothetical protein [Pseudorhodoferax sp.]